MRAQREKALQRDHIIEGLAFTNVENRLPNREGLRN